VVGFNAIYLCVLGETLNMTLRNFIFLLTITLLGACNQAIDPNNEKPKNKLSSEAKGDTQKDINLILIEKIRSADSIILSSHTGNRLDTVKREEIFPELLFNNRINYKIIHEKQVLLSNNLDTLIKILAMPSNDADFLGAHCCDPHHTIFIVNKSQTSYLDLCFHCFCLTTSKDLELIKGYDEPKWSALMSFFRKLAFKYEMPDK